MQKIVRRKLYHAQKRKDNKLTWKFNAIPKFHKGYLWNFTGPSILTFIQRERDKSVKNILKKKGRYQNLPDAKTVSN